MITVRLRFAQAFTTEGIEMQTTPLPELHMSLNRFELINPFGYPIDKAWALRQLVAWLDDRLDVIEPTVYDDGIPAKGDEHA